MTPMGRNMAFIAANQGQISETLMENHGNPLWDDRESPAFAEDDSQRGL